MGTREKEQKHKMMQYTPNTSLGRTVWRLGWSWQSWLESVWSLESAEVLHK